MRAKNRGQGGKRKKAWRPLDQGRVGDVRRSLCANVGQARRRPGFSCCRGPGEGGAGMPLESERSSLEGRLSALLRDLFQRPF